MHVLSKDFLRSSKPAVLVFQTHTATDIDCDFKHPMMNEVSIKDAVLLYRLPDELLEILCSVTRGPLPFDANSDYQFNTKKPRDLQFLEGIADYLCRMSINLRKTTMSELEHILLSYPAFRTCDPQRSAHFLRYDLIEILMEFVTLINRVISWQSTLILYGY